MNKAVTHSSVSNCSGMLCNLLDQHNDNGAAMLSLIERYINHFSRRYGNLDFCARQDILQEVAIKLLCHGEQVREDCPKAWVYAVVRNQCVNHVRNRNRRLSVVKNTEDPEAEATVIGGIPLLTTSIDSSLLAELDCLQKIFDLIEARETGKADIELYTQYAFGLSYAEISERSKRTVNAIGQRISLLKGRLKVLIVECC